MQLALEGLKKIRAWEFAARFVFGGAICVGTGAIASAYGPLIGGLFLAFPAILPASLSMVMKHDCRADCVDVSLGAACGSIGMLAVGLVVWKLGLRLHPALVLSMAALAWLVVSVCVWKLDLADRPPERQRETNRTD